MKKLIIICLLFAGCSNYQRYLVKEGNVPLEIAHKVVFPGLLENKLSTIDDKINVAFNTKDGEKVKTQELISISSEGVFTVNGKVAEENEEGDRLIADSVRRGMNRMFIESVYKRHQEQLDKNK